MEDRKPDGPGDFGNSMMDVLSNWLKRMKSHEESLASIYKEYMVDGVRGGSLEEHYTNSVRELTRCLLSPLVANRTCNPSSALKPSHLKMLEDVLEVEPPVLASASVNILMPFVSNARSTGIDFDVKKVAKLWGIDEECPGEGLLMTHGTVFLEKLFELYFAAFGRGNTLNEYLLDKYLDIPDETTAPVMIVSYRKSLGRNVALAATQSNGLLTVQVTAELSRILTGIRDNEKLDALFWKEAWKIFSRVSGISNQERGGPARYRDWVPAAVRRFHTLQDKEAYSLFDRLAAARQLAEREVLRKPGGLLEALDLLYPDHGDTGIGSSATEKLRRLLLMLQGNLCLVPWALDKTGEKLPLPVVVVPALASKLSRSSWTFILGEQGGESVRWDKVQRAAQDFFKRISGSFKAFLESWHERPEQFGGEQNTHKGPGGSDWGNVKWYGDLLAAGKRTHADAIQEELKPLISRAGIGGLAQMCRSAAELAGSIHEGRPSTYTFLYGAPEALRHVDRILSNESSQAENTKAPKGYQDSAEDAFVRRCEGHYSLFQQTDVAAFIDSMHTSPSVGKMVLLKHPPDSDRYAMRRDILQTDHLALRWITWKVCHTFENTRAKHQPRVIGIVCGGDGIVSVFSRGRLILRWDKRAASDEDRCSIGIEFISRHGLDGDNTNSLNACIEGSLPGKKNPLFARDLTAAIYAISNTTGEGATFIIGGRRASSDALCDMVPDHFKMSWAHDRILTDVEHQMLYSLAVMDGAVHIAAEGDGQDAVPWLCARRYVAAAPKPLTPKRPRTAAESLHDSPGQGTTSFSADRLVEYFDQWRKMLRKCRVELDIQSNEVRDLNEGFWKWRREIGKKGARHRSVFQFCLALAENLNGEHWIDNRGPLVCTISADGPVNLYQMRKCSAEMPAECDTARKSKGFMCPGTFLWTKRII